MKNTKGLNLEILTTEEQRSIDGGSEFSESVFRGIGWFVGSIAAIGQSFLENQSRVATAGYHPIPT